MDGEDEYRYLALYEFESYEKMMETANTDTMKQLVKEYNEAFGVGNRRRIFAVELKALTVG
jgi:hypothetical protein